MALVIIRELDLDSHSGLAKGTLNPSALHFLLTSVFFVVCGFKKTMYLYFMRIVCMNVCVSVSDYLELGYRQP